MLEKDFSRVLQQQDYYKKVVSMQDSTYVLLQKQFTEQQLMDSRIQNSLKVEIQERKKRNTWFVVGGVTIGVSLGVVLGALFIN